METLTNEEISKEEKTRIWASEKFGIPREDVVWYNSGVCYDRIVVKTKESADKVTLKMKGQCVNGGMFDGMALGSQNKQPDGSYDVMC